MASAAELDALSWPIMRMRTEGFDNFGGLDGHYDVVLEGTPVVMRAFPGGATVLYTADLTAAQVAAARAVFDAERGDAETIDFPGGLQAIHPYTGDEAARICAAIAEVVFGVPLRAKLVKHT